MFKTASLILLSLIISGCSGKTATEPANAAAGVYSAIDDAIALLEAKQYEQFMEQTMALEDLERIKDSNLLAESIKELSNPQSAEALLNTLKSLRELTPEMSDDGTIAWFDFIDSDGRSVERAFVNTDGSWRVARRPPPRPKMLRLQNTKNNLRTLCLAAINFESRNMKLPANAIYSKDGKPLLSWRVQLLQFIGQKNLYDQFRQDEPWDSEHNIKLLDMMPEVFKSSDKDDSTKTSYLALVGPETVMTGTNDPCAFSIITDGSSNTIMFVEVNEDLAQPWTKPADLEFDPENPKNGLGGMHDLGFIAAMCDGSVYTFGNDIGDETIKRLVLKRDGQVIDKSVFQR